MRGCCTLRRSSGRCQSWRRGGMVKKPPKCQPWCVGIHRRQGSGCACFVLCPCSAHSLSLRVWRHCSRGMQADTRQVIPSSMQQSDAA